MKLAHTITLSVFAKPGEDEKKIMQALVSLVPFGLEQEKLKVRKSEAEGFDGSIRIFELVLEKERHTTKFIEHLKGKLSKKENNELATQENRIDEECAFYIRFDKQKLLAGEWSLTDTGNCYHIKMSLAAFPKKRDAALQVARRMFS